MALTNPAPRHADSNVALFNPAGSLRHDPVRSTPDAGDNTPHVLKVIRGFNHDGPGILVLNLLRAWRREDIRVSVLALNQDGPLRTPIARELGRLDGALYSVPSAWRKWRQYSNYLGCLSHFIGATHMHSHLIRADMIGRSAARTAQIPYLVTEHGVHGWTEKGRLLRPAVSAWYRWYGPDNMLICAISAKVRRDLIREGVAPQNIRLTENGVDLRHFQPAAADKKRRLRAQLGIPDNASPVIAVLGSLLARKRPMTALRTVQALASQHGLNPYLLYIGDGPQHRWLQKQVVRLKLRPHVRFCNHVLDPAPLLNASDALLHPADEEPFGLAVAEAQACGLPAITRTNSGADELAPDQAVGATVQTDNATDWADALIQACAQRGQGAQQDLRGNACRRFNIARTADEYLQLYRAAAPADPGAL